MMMLFGILMVAIVPSVPPGIPDLPQRFTKERHLLTGIINPASPEPATRRGPKPRSDRRNLLKHSAHSCPVCLEPLDTHNARGETITCACGAVWERRYM